MFSYLSLTSLCLHLVEAEFTLNFHLDGLWIWSSSFMHTVSCVERIPAAAQFTRIGVYLSHRCFQRKSVLREYDLAKASVHTNETQHIISLLTRVCTWVSSVSNALGWPVMFALLDGRPLLITCWLMRRPCLKTSWVSIFSITVLEAINKRNVDKRSQIGCSLS